MSYLRPAYNERHPHELERCEDKQTRGYTRYTPAQTVGLDHADEKRGALVMLR
jgi:hypothetical protein